jgi:hypothetical protein
VPILDAEARNASLANDYGSARGAGAADSHELELWDGDPTLEDSAELSGNGYAAAEIVPADWTAPDGGMTTATVTFDAPTGEWTAATHWVLRDPVTGYGWDYQALSEELNVTGASDTGPEVLVAVFYNDNLED